MITGQVQPLSSHFSPLGIVEYFPTILQFPYSRFKSLLTYRYCFLSYLLRLNQLRCMIDNLHFYIRFYIDNLHFYIRFYKTQEAWQEVDPDEYSYEASCISCCLALNSLNPNFEPFNINICYSFSYWFQELVALGEVVGTESRGLSADTLASLPSVKYKTQDVQDGNTEQYVQILKFYSFLIIFALYTKFWCIILLIDV